MAEATMKYLDEGDSPKSQVKYLDEDINNPEEKLEEDTKKTLKAIGGIVPWALGQAASFSLSGAAEALTLPFTGKEGLE